MAEAVAVGTKKLFFREGEFVVKTLETEQELRQSYVLRHRVFAERLRWVPQTESRLESDMYDAWSTSIGVFSDWGALLGMFRLLPAAGPIMLESEFRPCLMSGHAIRKERDTVEITRLTVDPCLSQKGLSSRLMAVLCKGVYQWSVENDIRFLYMVVEKRFLRVLRMMGFPCEPISHPISLPPAGAVSVAAVLDWDDFRHESPRRQQEFFEWVCTVNPQRSYQRSVVAELNEAAA